jgi:hypothetical protein
MSWLRAFKIGGGLALINYIVSQYILFVADIGRHDFVIAFLCLGLIVLGLLMIISGWRNQSIKDFVNGILGKK